MRWRVTSLTTSGRCSARDTVATETLAMAAISLIVLTRAGVAAARVALAVGRLPLDPSELTVYRLLVDAAPHDSTRLANQRAIRGRFPTRPQQFLCNAM